MRRVENRLYRQREAVDNEPFRDGTMNPTVKKLAEQAGMNIKTNVIGTALVFGTFEGYKTSHITVEELEMFAELVAAQEREWQGLTLDDIDDIEEPTEPQKKIKEDDDLNLDELIEEYNKLTNKYKTLKNDNSLYTRK